jgi:exonuclease 3'-5' domain-containing protein 1
MSTYTYCHSEALLHSAIKRLSTSPEILFDCEGKTLGCKGGKLALVSLGTSFHRSRNEIYLVDILCYERDTLKPLFDILKDPKRPKIVFDGRNDFSELYHGFGVELKGVLDLQLADIVSRDGESEDTQLRRLSPGIRRGDIEAARASYTMVHRLSGLKGCAIEHKVAVETEKKRMCHLRPVENVRN